MMTKVSKRRLFGLMLAVFSGTLAARQALDVPARSSMTAAGANFGKTPAGSQRYLAQQSWPRYSEGVPAKPGVGDGIEVQQEVGAILRGISLGKLLVVAAVAGLAGAGALRCDRIPAAQEAANPQSQASPPPERSNAALPRGKRLVMKDGSFQLCREYRVEGERVKYYSVERSQWEEIPKDMVDWPATEQAELARQHTDAALAAKVGEEESARKAVFVDVDASVEIGPGVFLPDGEGIFALDGSKVFPLTQAETDVKLSKSQVAKQILVPIPIIPSRHTISLLGEHAKIRSTNGQMEFYMRTKDARAPDVVLIRTHEHSGNRRLENIDRLFGEEMARRNTLPMERWEVVKGVSRFTLSQKLAPGEYALAEIMRGSEEDLYVWDFGIDAGAK